MRCGSLKGRKADCWGYFAVKPAHPIYWKMSRIMTSSTDLNILPRLPKIFWEMCSSESFFENIKLILILIEQIFTDQVLENKICKTVNRWSGSQKDHAIFQVEHWENGRLRYSDQRWMTLKLENSSPSLVHTSCECETWVTPQKHLQRKQGCKV